MISQDNVDTTLRKLSKYSKVKIGSYPTSIDYLKRVSKDLGIDVFIKRDDSLGPAFGGHYTRSMEYIFGEIIENNYDSVVHGGPSTSNQNRIVAACCAMFDLECHLVLRKKLDVDNPKVGNLFLILLMGAFVYWVNKEMGTEIDIEKNRLLDQLKKRGKNPYLFDRKHISLLSCFGMLDFSFEIFEQLDQIRISPDYIYLAGCGPTHSGILLGTLLGKRPYNVIGVRPLHWDALKIVEDEVRMTLKELGLPDLSTKNHIINPKEFVGEDYAIPTNEGNQAIKYFAQKEAIIFDPVYTGKMAACFLNDVRKNKLKKGSTVLLIHSGGTPLTIAFSDVLANDLKLNVFSNQTK